MSIRRLQYQIDYVHMLTFRDEYKEAINSYFGFPDVEYGIDNENTIQEGIRLIFKRENFAIILRKEAITFIYEGNISELAEVNGLMKIFWEIYEKVTHFKAYMRCTRHLLLVHAVVIKEENEILELLKNPTYFTVNPVGELDDFACMYEKTDEDKTIKLTFGNYSENDIKKHQLKPFNTEYNSDLEGNVGLMGRLEYYELQKKPTHKNFLNLVAKAKDILSSFNLNN